MKHRVDETREFGDVDANRQLRRRIAQWVGWPLSVLVAIAVGAAWLNDDPAPASSQPAPAVTTTLGPSGVATAPPAAPRPTPKPVPATAGVAAPHPTARQTTSGARSDQRDAPPPRVSPKPKPSPTAPPSSVAPSPSRTPTPVCVHLLIKDVVVCL